MIIDFKSFLESFNYEEQWLLCVYYKSQNQSMATKKPLPNEKGDIAFTDFILVERNLTFKKIIQKPSKLNLNWNFVAISPTTTDRSLSDVNEFIDDMKEKLIAEFSLFAIFDKEGYFIDPKTIN